MDLSGITWQDVDWGIILTQLFAFLAIIGGIWKWLGGRADRQAAQYNQLAQALANVTEALHNAEDVIADVQTKLKESRAQVDALTQQVKKLEEITVARADRVARLEAENEQLKAQVSQLNQEKEELKRKLDTAIRRIAELERKENGGAT